MTESDLKKIEITLRHIYDIREMLPAIRNELTNSIKAIEQELVECYLEGEDV